MHVDVVEPDALSPYLRDVADNLYPELPPDLVPTFERFIRMLGNAPDHAERLFPFYLGIWLENGLGPKLTELARLAIANGTQCPICLDARYSDEVTEADVTSIPDDRDGRFAARERAALRFATDFGGDHHAIGEEHFAELREHFTDREITELLLFCGLALGIGRILKVTELVEPACPVGAR
jgi:alkylhydroperoxidase family enzyme